ncbi:MAG: ATP-binding domain-containing protein [Allosphingosinicella sp.]
MRITRNDAGRHLANGDRFTVAAVAPDPVTLEGAGRRVELPTDRPLHLEHAYATTVHGAQGLTSDRVTLEGAGRRVELPTDRPLHLEHAYATTVHGAQGLTSDRVLIEAQTNSRTTARDVYYVAISRARHEARIYTNDLGRLPAAVARENRKDAALDLVRERGKPGRDHGAQRSLPSERDRERA